MFESLRIMLVEDDPIVRAGKGEKIWHESLKANSENETLITVMNKFMQ
jgi:hypothetical protein